METQVKINRLLALGTAFLVLASQACNNNSAQPDAVKSGSRVSNAVVAAPVTGSLSVSMSPAALPSTAFSATVTFLSSTGTTLDVSDVVTVSAVNGTTAATMGGTLSVAAAHGVATFSNLTLATVSTSYTLTFAGSGVSVTAPAVKPLLKVVYSEDDQLSVGGAANTSAAAAQTISPNVPIFGTLGGGEVHYYKFAATAGQLVSVASYGNRLDLRNWDTSLRLKLVASNGTTEIARSGAVSAAASGVDTGFGMIRIPTAGTWYLVADQDQAGFASGKFGVLLTLPAVTGAIQTEAEASGTVGTNDTPATAEALSPGVMFGHYDNPSTNVSASDFYKITITAPTRVHMELSSARNGFANGSLVLWDPAMTLQDAVGNILWQSDNTCYLDPTIDYVIVNAGTYYVRVTRSEYPANTASAPYGLLYTATAYAPVTAAAAASNTASTAVAYKTGTDEAGSFTAAGTQYFSFAATAGDVVRLTIEDKSELQTATTAVSSTSSTNTVTSSGQTTGTIASPSGSTTAPATGTTIGTTKAIPVGQSQQVGATGPVIAQPTTPVGSAPPVVIPTGLDATLLASDGVTQLALAAASSTPTETMLNTRQTILQATGTYYVKVTSVAAGKFGFRIDTVASSSREVEPNDTAATGTAIGANGWSSGVISTATDVDHYKISCAALQLCTVSVLAAAGNGIGTTLNDWGSALIPVLEVRDSSGNLITSSSADRKGLTNYAESTFRYDSHIETSFRASATGGTYDVAIYDQDKQFGPTYYYALHVWKNQ
jgi:Bacterial pre-peptidase C-terminal domain